MIDWHSHVLPCIDDGSKSVEESLLLLNSLRSQGINTVIATPHYNADHDSVLSFLLRREASFQNLSQKIGSEDPKILLGAEVRYYPGISRLEGLPKLTIGESKLLLLEMPQSKWTEYTLRELDELSRRGDLTLVLAHIERCLPYQTDATWLRLYESGILMQVNASFFCDFFQKWKALRLLRDGKIHFIGSDCHNMKCRPPMLDKAYQVISKKLGNQFIRQMNEYGNSLLFQTNKTL